eukprot:TRINITY_DN8944_c1_g1_i6.p1 TRINITY_DN8944_c1_g1~~TRINITY_DN8944_c1_g1_i6.p1  ORF type:complete len:360 (-),score=30.08 TRINITY_DN8944_c1_g1_i6:961-2019(-)
MQCVSNKTKLFSMFFGAQECTDMELAVRKRLNGFLLRFDEDLGGVIMEYSSAKLLQRQMYISSNRTPQVYVELVVDVILFNPKPGKKLVGQVNHISGDFLSILVYGVFNASIYQSSIRGNFQKVSGSDMWVNNTNRKETISQGTWVVFEVVQVDIAGNALGIVGSMFQPTSGPIKQTKKKRRTLDTMQENGVNMQCAQPQQLNEMSPTDQVQCIHTSQSTGLKDKKKLRKGEKRKRWEEKQQNQSESKKKKKRKQEQNKDDDNNDNQNCIHTSALKTQQQNNGNQDMQGQLGKGDIIELLDSDDSNKKKSKKQKKKKHKVDAKNQSSNSQQKELKSTSKSSQQQNKQENQSM